MGKTSVKMGRPKKPVDQLQAESIYVRVTVAEKRAVEAAAGDRGLAAWAREVLLRAAKRVR
jgi:hypothetical protein